MVTNVEADEEVGKNTANVHGDEQQDGVVAVDRGEEAPSLPAGRVIIGDVHNDAVIALSHPRSAVFPIAIPDKWLALVTAHCSRLILSIRGLTPTEPRRKDSIAIVAEEIDKGRRRGVWRKNDSVPISNDILKAMIGLDDGTYFTSPTMWRRVVLAKIKLDPSTLWLLGLG